MPTKVDFIDDARPEHPDDKPYFLYDRNVDSAYYPDCFDYFESSVELECEMDAAIQSYLTDEGFWDEEVTFLLAGKNGKITHTVQQIDLVERPPEEDLEDCYDKDGEYWHPDWGFRCNYEFVSAIEV